MPSHAEAAPAVFPAAGRGRGWASLALALLLAACVSTPRPPKGAQPRPSRGPVPDAPVKVGKPYQVLGIWYYPADDADYDEVGIASWYGSDFHGGQTANGERYDMDMVGAAHKTLPLPSYVEVTSLRTGRRILVRVNDRGPFVPNRIIDLSRRAAGMLGIDKAGTGPVRVRRIFPGEAERLALRSGRMAAPLPDAGPAELAEARARLAVRAADPQPRPAIAPTPAIATAWYVQIGAYGELSRAERLAAELGGTVQPVGGLYRVRLGPFEDESSAALMLAQLGSRGYQGARLVRPGS
ncbi:septal ring lytic transglycosylase RlpA family lipoprotein [Sphingomonas oleivorans]|uniref:Endolytic peptidoglycan transglycosylase RlpA n=1 Tax=Sphingomonas oleivorans TaxID=1735121 RepID=A0A2T5FYM7_9SPHN|nr:septal ring lytic transglycosylase RlpA family protein [Sphingomonas oleivorans]PTQ11621.1 septal ring lytic transglycosylase RlpA family lipoprotein [Sphingomonas oleivorans]